MLLIKTKEGSSVKGKRKGFISTKKWKEERCLRCSIERTYEQLEAMKTVDGASLCSFWDDLDKTTDSFKGFNLEKRVEGKEMFELDRAELLSSTLVYLNARFNPLLQNPVLMWMEGSVEHRRWPAADHPTPGALMDWGNEDLRSLAKHFSGLEAMQHFDVNEAIFEYNRAKIELPGEPFFILSYRQFGSTSRHTTIMCMDIPFFSFSFDPRYLFSQILRLASVGFRSTTGFTQANGRT